MAGSLTKIQFRLMEVQQNLNTQNNLLLHFFSFNGLNKIDVEVAISLKESMYKSALEETFQSID